MIRPVLSALALCVSCSPEHPTADYRLNQGIWFNGTAFEQKTAYVVDGKLLFSERALQSTYTLDLAGAYVVPPYCEGHNHNLGASSEDVQDIVSRYLNDGVFYAVMPGSFKLYRDLSEKDLNTPTSIDVAFGNNGLTAPGGHPRGLRESLMERFGSYPEFTKETMQDVGYFEAETFADVKSKFELIKAENPAFLKVMLYFSEEYDLRKDNPDFFGRRGIDPSLMPALVQLAHHHDLRVAVHVESDFDMLVALKAGADIIMHLPSYDSTEIVSEESIELALTNDAAIVTTFTVANRYRFRDPELFEAIFEAQRNNLKRLEQAGVNLVVGSDSFRDTSRGEADHLAQLQAVTNLTLLKMWTENCARMAFPTRKIGKLKDGYEANFLALSGNPLDDFSFTKQIEMRFKDGSVLEVDTLAENVSD
ncbi:MAG: amidohydrolase family protein [Pseudomonadota bacterium]